MQITEASGRVFAAADQHGKNAEMILARPDFGTSPMDGVSLMYELTLQGSLWQLAASVVKDLTEPLKSIVNK